MEARGRLAVTQLAHAEDLLHELRQQGDGVDGAHPHRGMVLRGKRHLIQGTIKILFVRRIEPRVLGQIG